MALIRPRVVRPDKPGPGRIMVARAEQDPLLTAILKWIPVEVLTVYKTVDGIIPTNRSSFHLYFAVGMVIACPLWIAFATKPASKKIAWRQVILAPFAFVCWGVAMQNDIMKGIVPGWETWIGSVILGAGTILLPIIDGILEALGVRQN